MLKLAREKGEKLLAELIKRQAEVEAHPPDLPAEQLAQGREAMEKAIAATRRMLQSLQDATRIAAVDNN